MKLCIITAIIIHIIIVLLLQFTEGCGGQTVDFHKKDINYKRGCLL